MDFLLIGIGNEIKKDDAIGLIVAEKIFKKLDDERIGFELFTSGKILLLDEIKGYKKVFIVDSIKTKEGKVGNWYSLAPEDLDSDSGLFATHNISLRMIEEIGKSMNEVMPEIKIFAIEVENPFEIGEGLSKKLSDEVPRFVSEIGEKIQNEITS